MRLARALSPLFAVVLLGAAFALYLAHEPQVVRIEAHPDRIALAPKAEQRVQVEVRTAFPDPFRAPALTWRVTPENLGTIAADGVFRAGPASGKGTLAASAGGASVTIAVAIECPAQAETAGLAFTVICTSGADVYFEATLSGAARQTVLAAVDEDVARIEADYGRAFARRPLVYVLASKQSFGVALRDVFAAGGSLPPVAIEADGVYASGPDLVGIDWEEAGKLTPFTTLRHELAHKMNYQIVGANARAMPAWLDEGSARLAETTISGTAWIDARERVFAVSMAATGTLLPLAELADVDAWGARAGLAASHQYHEASQAVRLLREDIGAAGVVRLYEELGAGSDFPSAYAAVAGADLSVFASTLAQRLRSLAPAPGITTATDSPRGGALTLLLYGWTPDTQVTVTLSGGGREGRSVESVSAYGTALVVVAGELPPGTYTIRASGANGRATTTARKSS